MRGANESIAQAKAEYQTFVATQQDAARKEQIAAWLAGHVGYDEKALRDFGKLLHAVTDSTSPAHQGFQTWNVYNLFADLRHSRDERSVTPAEMNSAVALAHAVFFATFYGEGMFGWMNVAVPKLGVETSIGGNCQVSPDGKSIICK